MVFRFICIIYRDLFLCTKFLPSSKAYPHDSSKCCQCQYHICIPAVVCALVFPATRLLKFSQLVPLPLHAQNIETCFKTHPISPTFSQLSTNHEAFFGGSSNLCLPDFMDSNDFFMPCLKLIRPKVGGGSFFKISSSQVGMSDEETHHNNENTSRFLWKKQTKFI